MVAAINTRKAKLRLRFMKSVYLSVMAVLPRMYT